MMREQGLKNPHATLESLGLHNVATAYWNLTPSELTEHSIRLGQGVLSDTGALCIRTGKYTGRSPKDRYIVKDELTASRVDWGKVNLPFEPAKFESLYKKVKKYFEDKDIYIADACVCADANYRLRVRVAAEYPSSAQFAGNMFIRLSEEELSTFTPDWTVLCAPGFDANHATDGTADHKFIVVNFTKQVVIIGGTGYTGEIKKSIFSILNFTLPSKSVFPMHCSANMGNDGDVSIFFGLSGTGKTTLSADVNRHLIGDDEHGWSNEGVFNFEGGCYAKCVDLTEEREPEIFRAIKSGAILENIRFVPNTRRPDYTNISITENTRVSYPIQHIPNALIPSVGGHPTNVFFLTCDAYGVLPPISRLTPGQAMYHFLSGYTAKVAGTEDGVTEPTKTFSTCFGAPFMPLHPTEYAKMLGERMKQHNVSVWLVNTGWSGGGVGVGKRMKLAYTRAMITAALEGKLQQVDYVKHPVFGLAMPTSCPNVPSEVLNPRNTWTSAAEYDKKAALLAQSFVENFEQFAARADEETLAAAPLVAEKA